MRVFPQSQSLFLEKPAEKYQMNNKKQNKKKIIKL